MGLGDTAFQLDALLELLARIGGAVDSVLSGSVFPIPTVLPMYQLEYAIRQSLPCCQRSVDHGEWPLLTFCIFPTHLVETWGCQTFLGV